MRIISVQLETVQSITSYSSAGSRRTTWPQLEDLYHGCFGESCGIYGLKMDLQQQHQYDPRTATYKLHISIISPSTLFFLERLQTFQNGVTGLMNTSHLPHTTSRQYYLLHYVLTYRTTREENVALMKKRDRELIVLISIQEPTAGIS